MVLIVYKIGGPDQPISAMIISTRDIDCAITLQSIKAYNNCIYIASTCLDDISDLLKYCPAKTYISGKLF